MRNIAKTQLTMQIAANFIRIFFIKHHSDLLISDDLKLLRSLKTAC